MRWKVGEFCRRRLRVRVNCWYCNENTTVPYENVNCFECPHCDQYNGFSNDGGYNKDIPAQHDELLNHPINAANQTKSLGEVLSSKSLCHYCNINQELKIQQLAGFVASKPSKYDQEIEQYRPSKYDQEIEQYRLQNQLIYHHSGDGDNEVEESRLQQVAMIAPWGSLEDLPQESLDKSQGSSLGISLSSSIQFLNLSDSSSGDVGSGIENLERVYRLCAQCELRVKETLIKQKSLLLGLKQKWQRSGITPLATPPEYSWLLRRLTSYSRQASSLLGILLTIACVSRFKKDHVVWLLDVFEAWPLNTHKVVVPLALRHELSLTALGIVLYLASLFKGHRVVDYLCLLFWTQLHVQCWVLRFDLISTINYSMLQVTTSFVVTVLNILSLMTPHRKFLNPTAKYFLPRKVPVPLHSTRSHSRNRLYCQRKSDQGLNPGRVY
uniref:Ima1 N-terminal domain-containing protein n=1 Tax=Timema monikensis TaxID=170555 RepID=A0A7R9E7S1_9NEOP|nr:unnamed protein product [Timema monikensis]